MLNNRSAFTLIEVLFAIVILATTLVILSEQHFKSILNILKGRESIDRVFVIKKEFITNSFKFKEDSKEIKSEDEILELKMISSVESIQKKSALKDFIDDIDIIQTKGEWRSRLGSYGIKIVGFAPKSDSSEKESQKRW